MAAIKGKPQNKNTRAKNHNRLFDVRMAQELSQRELASISGVSRQTIMRIENGDVEPSIDSCRKICSALGVQITEVFNL